MSWNLSVENEQIHIELTLEQDAATTALLAAARAEAAKVASQNSESIATQKAQSASQDAQASAENRSLSEQAKEIAVQKASEAAIDRQAVAADRQEVATNKALTESAKVDAVNASVTAESARDQASGHRLNAQNAATAASASASQAANNASISTQKAAEASQSASDALVSKNAAKESELIAIDKASIATAKASEANQSAIEAGQSASAALGSKNAAKESELIAIDKASIATAKASEANQSAVDALDSQQAAQSAQNAASSSASTATAQAGIATTQANNAATSASQALTSRNQAEGFKNDSQAILSDIQALLPNFPRPAVFALNKRAIQDSAIFGQKLKPTNDFLKAFDNLNPSLVMVPSAQRAGQLYSVLPEGGAGDFTVSRNGSATFIGSNGLVQTAGVNVPRFEYNTDGSFKGLLVEPAATNFIIGSNMNGAVVGNLGSGGSLPNGWVVFVNAGLNIRVESIGSINGYTYIDLKISGTATSTVLALLFNNFNTVSATLNQFWVGSIFANRQNNSPNHRLTLVGRNNAGGFVQSIATDITIPFNSSQRFSLSGQITNSNVTFINFGLSIDLNIGQNYDFVTRVYAPQLETGSVATSYIPTVATTITRPADVITRSNAQDLIGQTEGAFYVETIVQRDQNLNARVLFAITLNISTNIFGIGLRNRTIQVVFRNGGPLISPIIGNQYDINTRLKICVIYTTSEVKYFANGLLISTQAKGSGVPTSFNGYTLSGDSVFFSPNPAPRTSAAIFKTALSDAQAIALTTL